MGDSKNKSWSSGGCFSGIVRIVLCKGKLQTHPAASDSSDLNKTKMSPSSIKAPEAVSVTAPGVVARLMGLDAVPLSTRWISTRAMEQGALRSRSVNFMDYLLDLDHFSNEDEAFHRRVKSSLSFREVPELLQWDRNLLVLYLKDQETTINFKLKSRKSEFKEDHVKAKSSRKKRATHKVRERRRSPSRRGSKSENEPLEESEFMIKVKRKKQQTTEQAISVPVSVIKDPEIPIRDGLKSCQETMYDRNCIQEKKVKGRKMKQGKVSAELDGWKMKNEGMEEICREMEKHILDKILVKFVQDLHLIGLSMRNGLWL